VTCSPADSQRANADIDSPRGGIIRVLPQNLILLSESIKAQ